MCGLQQTAPQSLEWENHIAKSSTCGEVNWQPGEILKGDAHVVSKKSVSI